MFACGAVACPDGSPVRARPRRARAGMHRAACAPGRRLRRQSRSECGPTRGRHGGVLGVLRDAVLGSSRASTPVSRSQARVVDQISLLDVRSVLGDASLLAALSRGGRGCAPCPASSQPDRGGRHVHPRDGRLEGWCYLNEGYLIFLQVDGDSIRRIPGGARSTASTIARAAGAGVTLMRPGDVAVTSRPPARHRRPEGSVTAARSAHHYRRRPRDHYRATSLLRLFAEPDDNTTKRTILMTNGRKTRQRRQDQRPRGAMDHHRPWRHHPGVALPAGQPPRK
jgi:hypothetical protein